MQTPDGLAFIVGNLIARRNLNLLGFSEQATTCRANQTQNLMGLAIPMPHLVRLDLIYVSHFALRHIDGRMQSLANKSFKFAEPLDKELSSGGPTTIYVIRPNLSPVTRKPVPLNLHQFLAVRRYEPDAR